MHLERADGPVPAGLPILELHGRVVVGPALPRAEVGGAAAVLALLLRVGVRADGVDPLACLGLGLGLGSGLGLGLGLGFGLGLGLGLGLALGLGFAFMARPRRASAMRVTGWG